MNADAAITRSLEHIKQRAQQKQQAAGQSRANRSPQQPEPERAREHQARDEPEPPAESAAPPPPDRQAEEPQAPPVPPQRTAQSDRRRRAKGNVARRALEDEAEVQARLRFLTVGEHLGPIFAARLWQARRAAAPRSV